MNIGADIPIKNYRNKDLENLWYLFQPGLPRRSIKDEIREINESTQRIKQMAEDIRNDTRND